MHRKHLKTTAASAVVLAILLAGCAHKIPNPAPTPPQVKVSNAVNALAASLDAAITGLISARDNGKLSQEDLRVARDLATAMATTGKQIDAELRSADPWADQKLKIARLVVDSGVATAVKKLPPTAATILAASLALFNEISLGAGGPAL